MLAGTDLTEEIKWGAPCYTFDGKNVVGMAGFKSYFGLWFHQGALLADDADVLINAQEGTTRALRQWRMQSVKEIRPAIIRRYVKEAIQLVRDGRQIGPAKKKTPVLPPELKTALGKSTVVARQFANLTPGKAAGIRRLHRVRQAGRHEDEQAEKNHADDPQGRWPERQVSLLSGAGPGHRTLIL